MTERRQELLSAATNDGLGRHFDVPPSTSTTTTTFASTSTSGNLLLSDSMDYLGGASDFAEELGFDETGIRPRGRDLHSGPEKGNFCIKQC